MRSLGIAAILSATLVFGCAFLAQAAGAGDASTTMALLGVALSISGSVFVAADTLARQVRILPQASFEQLPVERGPAPGGEPAGAAPVPPGPAIRRPGFRREAA